jgi:hypothetical protein
MQFLYALTLFLSAALLFSVQPMFARMALPLLGGSPSVWNTALVFYQAILLAGYTYAHATTRWLGVRRQTVLHFFVLLLPLIVLPIGIPVGWRPPTTTSPVFWLLGLLLVWVGPPFFVVSATSPLLQQWFAGTRDQAARDPYFLYSASNLGSLLALISYPLLIETTLPLAKQSLFWAIGYGLLFILICVCGVWLWRSATPAPSIAPPPEAAPILRQDRDTLTTQRRLRWVALAFIPSSFMLSVTTYLSTDIAAIPLLWVIPLALYLLTFILSFAKKSWPPHHWLVRALPFALLLLALLLAMKHTELSPPLVSLHLLTFFMTAMVCHGGIARDRPAPRHLTEFYLWLSVGGVLGGLFNGLLAPMIFKSVVEYPLTLVLAALLLPRQASEKAKKSLKAPPNRRLSRPQKIQQFLQQEPRAMDVLLPLTLLLITGALIRFIEPRTRLSNLAELGLMFGLPALICFTFLRRPVRFGLGLGAILLASTLYIGGKGLTLYTERSFFGVNRVIEDPARTYHALFHGTTLHGLQKGDPNLRRQLLTYYSTTGPLGDLFNTLQAQLANREIAVVGLGAGSMACYRQPGQTWTFYEIDPSVERIARDPHYFTFLVDCAPEAKIILGDARLSLTSASPHQYQMIVLDAYSSDAIPIHLLTHEALQLYLDKLAPHGVLVFHLTNTYLELEPVVGRLAQEAGLVSLVANDLEVSQSELQAGKFESRWAIMAHSADDLGELAESPNWFPPLVPPLMPLWTDDFSSVLSVFRTP